MRERENAEMSLKEKWEIIRKNKVLILSLTLISVFLALVFVLQMKPIWEVSVPMRIGQAGDVDPLLQAVAPLETVAQIQSRILTPRFSSEVMQRLNAMDVDKQWYESNYPSLRAIVGKGPELTVAIKLQTQSPERARTLLAAVAQELEVEHQSLFQPREIRLKEHLARIDAEVSLLQLAIQKDLKKIAASEKSMTKEQMQSQIEGFNNLEQRKTQLDELVDPRIKFSTYQAQEVSVSELSQKKTFIVFSAFLLGLFSSIGIAFLRQSLGR